MKTIHMNQVIAVNDKVRVVDQTPTVEGTVVDIFTWGELNEHGLNENL